MRVVTTYTAGDSTAFDLYNAHAAVCERPRGGVGEGGRGWGGGEGGWLVGGGEGGWLWGGGGGGSTHLPDTRVSTSPRLLY